MKNFGGKLKDINSSDEEELKLPTKVIDNSTLQVQN